MNHHMNRSSPFILWLFLALFTLISCQKPMLNKEKAVQSFSGQNNGENTKMDGMTMVAPPQPFRDSPFTAMKTIHIDWVGIIPYAYTRVDAPNVKFGNTDWQWWGETVAGAEASIILAHKEGMNVLLKPQVYVPGSWTGAITYETEAEWLQWESEYETYIMTFAKMAAAQKVAVFCIGTEFKISSVTRPAYWEGLIEKIRKIYNGKLTYAANWDEYPHIRFWKKLDFIGVDAYFPLSDAAVPSVKELVNAWAPIEKQISDFSAKAGVPVLFTEYGYMSVEGCAGKTWVLEKDRSILKYSEQAQANAFEAAHQVFWNQSYWAGGFIWKWYPNEFAGEGRMAKDYTPQNKMSEALLARWYK